MNQDPKTVLQRLRALTPARALQHHEAQGIAERQATRLLVILEQREPPVDVGLIAELPRIEVRVVANRDIGGLSGTGFTRRPKTPRCRPKARRGGGSITLRPGFWCP